MLKKIPLLLFLFSLPITPCAAESLGTQHLQAGLAYERLGRFDESYTELQLASNLDPDSGQIALALGIVASRLGRYDEALRALEHSIAMDANSCASYYGLALLYEKKGLTDRALDSWNRFLGLNQDDTLKRLARKHIAYLQGLS
jgi:tetratricopeptide (TPR) repeat protein